MQEIYNNAELEQLVIKAMMIIHDPHNDKLIEAFDILDKQCFTNMHCKIIFAEMLKMHINGEHISDADMLNPLLAIDPKLLYLIDNKEDVVTPNSLVAWAKKLIKLRDRRAYKTLLDNALKSLNESGHDLDWEETINAIPDGLMKIQNNDLFSDANIYIAKQCVEMNRQQASQGIVQVSTGFMDLDKFFEGGLRKGTLTVIGAPPSAGKTEFSSRLALEITKQEPDKAALIFSLEMTIKEMTDKFIEHMANKPIKLMTETEYTYWEDRFAETAIHICEKSPVTIEFIRSVCKRMELRTGISVVVVDFLDKMEKPKNDLRSDEKLTEITSKLKDIAKDFNCNVIVLTQLNKAAINRSDKRPTMNDSKNSNGPAENADYWLGIKRIGQWDQGKHYPDSNLVEIIIDKNRFGDAGIFYLALHHHMYKEIGQDFAQGLVRQGNELRKEDNQSISNKQCSNIFKNFE